MVKDYELNAETGEGVIRELTEQEKIELEKNKPSVEQLRDEARNQRNLLLSETDWTQLSDAPVDAAAYATYRQQLRDLDMTDPEAIEWPVKP